VPFRAVRRHLVGEAQHVAQPGARVNDQIPTGRTSMILQHEIYVSVPGQTQFDKSALPYLLFLTMERGKLAPERPPGWPNRKKGILGLLLLVAGLSANQEIARIRPEDVGWSSARLEEAARYAGEIGYSALVLAHDGRIFFTWGQTERNYLLHSVCKPLLGALYGLYVEARMIDLDITLEKLGIDDIPPHLTQTEKQATIRQLLQGRSGVYHVAAAEEAGMIAARPPGPVSATCGASCPRARPSPGFWAAPAISSLGWGSKSWS
jgi:hypothetical protein